MAQRSAADLPAAAAAATTPPNSRMPYVSTLYGVGQKTWRFTFVHIFANYWSIFKFFTSTPCRQFAIRWLLHIPPHHGCVYTLLCEIWMKYAYITIITNEHFGKIEKKTLQTNIAVNGCMTLDCVGLTQSSVIQIIHRNVGLKCFFHLP